MKISGKACQAMPHRRKLTGKPALCTALNLKKEWGKLKPLKQLTNTHLFKIRFPGNISRY